MAAANKLSTVRNPRRNVPSHASAAANGASAGMVKQEDLSIPLHQRPGTSTGYEGDHDSFLYHQSNSWHVDSKSNKNHSFRDSTQSFLGPPAYSTSPAAGAAPGQSFHAFTSSVNFGFSGSARDGRPRTSSSRPPTSGGIADPNSRSLPPLAAVVSATFSSSPREQHIQSFPAPPGSAHGQPGGGSLLLPGPPLTLRRPTTATRPGTAPASASLFSAKSSFAGGAGMGFSRPELSIQSLGRPSSSFMGGAVSGSYDSDSPSSPSGNDASPFFFSPPTLDAPATTAAVSSTSPPVINPRKRAFAGPDGPYDGSASRDAPYDYDYGSESRPQSRRLSVLELCNDSDGNAGASFLLSSARAESRPTTSGLVTSASALAIADRPSPTLSSPVQSRPSSQYRATAAATTAGGNGRDSDEEEFRGERLSSTIRHNVPSPSSVLHYRSGTGGSSVFGHSPSFSNASAVPYSPRSSSGSPFSPRSPIPGADSSSISRRHHGDDGQHDQIRFSRASHTSPALGLKV